MRGPSIIPPFHALADAPPATKYAVPEEGIMSPRTLTAPAGLDHFAFWLADHAQLSLLEMHKAFCEELVVRGLPLWRSSLGLELLHPEQSGVRSLWTVNEGMKQDHGSARGREHAGLSEQPGPRWSTRPGGRSASGSTERFQISRSCRP